MTDVKILNRTTGKLETLPVEEADRKVATQAGFDYPSLDELERHERLEKYGDQQGTAAAETLGRTATFGAFQGFGSQADIEGRRRTLAEESPGVQFAAQAIGSTLPALATGGVATGAVGALGLGARAATAASVIAEGASGGLADEIEQAALDQRPVSAGRAMLVGVGGELIGRAIPAAVKAGIAGIRGAPAATAAVAGEAVEDLTEAAAKKADTRLADAAPHMPPGPERDAALAATAETQRARATEQMGGAAERAAGLVQEIADDAPKKLAKEIEGTSPSQIRWAAEMAGQLRTIAETAPETHAAMLRESAQALLDAKNGKAIWSAAADARKRIREVASTEGAAERARKIADRMRARDKQAGGVVVGGEPGSTFKAPLDDVQVPDKEGYLENASPRRLKKHAEEIQQAADTALAGKSLQDLRALPLDEGPGAAGSRAKVDAFKADKSFRETGMLPSNNDRGRGGLPAFGIEPDGQVYLSNGRHRLTAALESGQETLVANLKRYDKKGNVVWDYVGPVRVGKPAAAPVASKAGERGMVDLGAAAGRVPWRDIAASPLGNVVGAGAGAALGGQAGGQEGAALGGLAGFAASLLLARGRGAGRGLGRALARAGERGSVTIGGEVANDVGAAGLKRTMAGARVLEHDFAKGAPDFSDWDPSDFGRGRGGSHAAGKHAPDYSGGETLSTYQRSIVDGLKKNAGFAENGRVTGDAGKLGSEPTFHVQADGSVKLVHGRLRLTAARELGRDTVYGRVVKGKGKEPTLVYEGPIKVGGGPRAVGDAPSAPAAPGQPPPAAKPPIVQADELLSGGQKAVDVWGRAGQGAADLDRAVAPGPGPRSHVDTLEDVTAAAERWKVGSDKARSGLAAESRAMREADSLHADVDRAEAGKGALRELAGAAAGELAEYAVERAVGAAVPGAGLALRGAKYLWRKLDDSAKAQIARTARTLMSPLTSSGRWGAARSATAMTALDRFKGDAPDARSAFEARKEMLQSAAASPQVAGQAMAQALAGLARESPNNFVMLARRMHESLQYVSQNLPPTVGISLAHPTGVPITDSELRDVADLWNTAFDPSSAFDDIARCEASPVQMRTLKELHPDIYAELQQSIVAQSPATFAQLDTQTKLSIDIMFGSDGAGGLFASSEAARYVATANKRVPPKPPGGTQLQPGATTDTVESSGVRAVRTGVTNKGSA